MDSRCGECGEEMRRVGVPCPDEREGCAVFHFKYECHKCKSQKTLNQEDQAFLDQAMIAAMQGLLSNPNLLRKDGGMGNVSDYAKDAANHCKALLEERNKMIGGGE